VEARTVADSRSVLVHWMGPTDANSAGFVHGGVVMKLIDEVAGLAAVRHSHQRVVTAGADRMTFEQPIHVGQLVTLHASVNAAWNTSMEVGVRGGVVGGHDLVVGAGEHVVAAHDHGAERAAVAGLDALQGDVEGQQQEVIARLHQPSEPRWARI